MGLIHKFTSFWGGNKLRCVDVFETSFVELTGEIRAMLQEKLHNNNVLSKNFDADIHLLSLLCPSK